MRKHLRYGDEGTIVSLREQVVAVLFVAGIAALLIASVTAPFDEGPGTIAEAAAAMQVDSGAAPANVSDGPGRSPRQMKGAAP